MGHARKSTMWCAAMALLGAGAVAPAQANPRSYHLLVETGVDAIAVQRVIGDSIGTPGEIGWISKDMLADSAAMSRLAGSADTPVLVVARDSFVADVAAGTGRAARPDRRLAADLRRVMPGDQLAVARLQ